MTDAAKPELYPQYCFHLSPTINRWCHFRIADIWALRGHRGFEGQDVYFHLNHPIKWVRISGVVVAVDERETWHFYTIDDGSGATLECVVPAPPRAAAAAGNARADAKADENAKKPPVADAPIDVGHVLDIKGSVGTFRDNRQIRAEKIVHLRSTDQEVVFWEKVAQLKSDVLSKPWVLDRREVRRCRKEEEEGRSSGRRRRAQGERHAKRTGLEKTGLGSVKPLSAEPGLGKKAPEETVPERAAPEKAAPRKTGLEKTGLAETASRRAGLEKATLRRTGLERTGTLGTGLGRSGLQSVKPARSTESHDGDMLAPRNGGESKNTRERKPLTERPARATGLEKRVTKPVPRLIPVRGKYDALGL